MSLYGVHKVCQLVMTDPAGFGARLREHSEATLAEFPLSDVV